MADLYRQEASVDLEALSRGRLEILTALSRPRQTTVPHLLLLNTSYDGFTTSSHRSRCWRDEH